MLNRIDIMSRMKEAKYEDKLIVTPLLSEDQIGPASIDIRLGSSIILPKRVNVDRHDVTEPSELSHMEARRFERVRLRYHSKFMLHPNQLILGVTFEYVSLPFNLFGMIISRSSWGRLGLIVATAAAVQPGYKGCLTLELVNVSESPMALYPGLPVGQLIFHEVQAQGGKAIYTDGGRYDCPTEAELPRFGKSPRDDELAFWGKSGSNKQ